jgi:hypothetical protein
VLHDGADLSARLAAGVKERSEAEAADRAYQEVLAEGRSAYADFNVVLQAFPQDPGRGVRP